MKKLLVSTLALSMLFAACKKAETTEPTVTNQQATSIKLNAPSSSETDFAPNENIVVAYTVTAGTDVTVSKVEFFRSRNGGQKTLETNITLDAGTKNKDISTGLNASATVGDVDVYTVVVTDSKQQTAAVSFTVKSLSGLIKSFNATMGAQTSTVAHFYSLTKKLSYEDAGAKANSADVDLVFAAAGGSYEPTILAPSYGSSASIYSDINSWSVTNSTSFGLNSVTSAQFDDMKDDSMILSNTSNVYFSVISPEENKVYTFKTVTNKYGFLRVKKINGTGTDKTIEFDLKMQR